MKAVGRRVSTLIFCFAIHLGFANSILAADPVSFAASRSPRYPADLTSAVSSGFVHHRKNGSYGPVPVPQDHPIDKIASWMAKLEWDQVDPFYGAALPLMVTPDRLFFVHNYHELPKSRDKWKQLRATGKWGRFIPREAHVAGYHAGFDLAVSWVQQKYSPDEVEKINQTIRSMYYTGDLERGLWRVGVLGIPGPWRDPRQVFKNLLWSAEADMLSVWEDTSEEATIAELFGPSRTKIPVELRSDCPPVFLVGCYRVPMRTWGFSGGAFIIGDVKRESDGTFFISPKIAGIPSHFVPLTESTYIIPARTVLKVGFDIGREYLQRSRNGDIDSIVVRDMDSTLTFRVEDEHTITALAGPLAGQKIYSMQSPFAPGGGESSGGGGESSGGGGESSGGGGESSGGGGESSGGGGESSGGGGESSGGGGPIVAGKDYYFVSDTLGNVAGLVNYEQLEKEVEDPEAWQKSRTMVNALLGLIRGTKGVDAIIKYRHGVYTEGKERIYRIGNKAIVNLHDFFMNYSAEMETSSLRHDFANSSMPTALELHRNDTAGIFGDLYLFKFKPSQKLDPRVFHPSVVQFNQLNSPELAALVLHNMWTGQLSRKPVDAVSIREWLSPGGAVSAASFEMINNRLRVTAIIPRFSKVVMDFPGEFVPKGTSFFQYVGAIDVTNGASGSMRFHGVANLEWDPHSNRWEFKIVMAGKVPAANVQTKEPNSPEGVLFSNSEGLAFQVFSLPLRVPANERLSELEVKPWEREQMELGLEKTQELKRKRQAEFEVAWKEAAYATTGMLSLFPKQPVNLALARSMNEYLAAFDEKFEVKVPGPFSPESEQVCRDYDRHLRLQEVERRMGLNIDTVFQESHFRSPRQLAFRVQMLEHQQLMQQFVLSEPDTLDALTDSAEAAFIKSSKLLQGVRDQAVPLADKVGGIAETVIRTLGPSTPVEMNEVPMAEDRAE